MEINNNQYKKKFKRWMNLGANALNTEAGYRLMTSFLTKLKICFVMFEAYEALIPKPYTFGIVPLLYLM